MTNCAFTIVAKNYIGLAQILGKSIKKHTENVDFFIFVADEFEQEGISLELNILIAKDTLNIDGQQWTDMSFKYDLTEFCTSIKPSCFEYIFSQGYEKAIYFDPDIYVFSSIEEIYKVLDNYDVALTPQIAGIHIDYTGEHPEWAMNVNGTFNLGFCGIRKSPKGERVVQWWKKRLSDNAFADRSTGNFTDQKWMDWMPGLLGNESLYVFHQLGMNMAPWNYFERELISEKGRLFVKYRTEDCSDQERHPLVFIHFAGYDYEKLKQGIISRKRIENLSEYEDLRYATDIYRQEIMENKDIFDRYIQETYTYATYDNGKKIDSFHRRLYHGLTTFDNMKFENPFSTGKDSFYEHIRHRSMISDEPIDKINKQNVSNISQKRKYIGILFSALFRVAGYKRYVLFVKSLYNYCRPEWHGFLIRK